MSSSPRAAARPLSHARKLVLALSLGALALSAATQSAEAAPTAATSQLSPHAAARIATALAGPTAPQAGRAWIQGLVTDQAGRFQDNVVVAAYRPGSNTPVASWITYAGPRGGAAHGWYRLYVPGGAGSQYQLRFSSPAGTPDPFKATTRAQAVVPASGAIVELPTTSLERARRATATVTLGVDKQASKAKKKGRLSVGVASADVSAVTGSVRVSIGSRTVGAATLSAAGTASFVLPKGKPGKYTVTVSYLGASNVSPATATVKIKVKKAKKPKKH